jgi:hypothetical protein
MKDIGKTIKIATKNAITTICILFIATYSFCTQITVPPTAEVVAQSTSYFQVASQTNIQIPLGGTLVVYNYLYVNLAPGDTLLIDATTSIGNNTFTRTQMLVKDLVGTKAKPILLKNKTGKIIQITQTNSNTSYGIAFHGCSNIIISGKEGNSSLNFKIKNFTSSSSMGISFDRNTKNVELANCEIGYIGAQAMQFKSSEPYNGSSAIVDTAYCRQYVLTGGLGVGKFHDNYIHHSGSEGFYIGSTAYNENDGTSITVNQSFANSLPSNNLIFYSKNSWRFLPHFIDTVLVYNNITDSTGWDGIQVAMAKYYRVYNNKVSNYGLKKDYGQMFGIIIGAPCIGEVNNNTINTGNGSAIQCFGVQNRFYNNLIIKPNLNPKESIWWAINAVYFNDKICTPQTLTRMGITLSQTNFEAFHNTIIMHPYDSGRAIMFMQNYASQTKGKCYNNLAVRDPFPNSLNPTVLTFPNPIFIANPQQSIFSNTNNFPSTDLQTVGFINPLINNYDLLAGCQVCRNAQSLILPANDKAWYDLVGKSRLNNVATNTNIIKPSYGCYEIQTSGSSLFKSSGDEVVTILWPNPIDKDIDKEISVRIEGAENYEYQTNDAYIVLIDLSGKITSIEGSFSNNIFKTSNIDFSSLSKGIYFAKLQIDNEVISTQKILLK